MKDNIFYVKSLEEDFYTKTLKGTRKVGFQSVQDMIKSEIIHPNTKSFGQKSRLSGTILSDKYQKTYRAQGIIFQTSTRPTHVLPFDLVVLSEAKKIVVHYYRIKDNLHFYYNHELIRGFEQFVFKDFESLVKQFTTPKDAWVALNKFREKAGYKKLPLTKYRLVEYNEVVFEKPVRIKPVAIFGYNKMSRAVAKKNKLPHFRTAKDFYRKVVLVK